MSAITVKGARSNERVYADLRDVVAKSQRAIRHSWFDVGKTLLRSANEEILRGRKTGRVYYVRSRAGGRRRRHVASAPGETHANMFGDLRRSLGWKVFGHLSMEFGYGVSPDRRNPPPRYARFVEYGTSRMAPRPSLENAVEAERAEIERAFAVGVRREFGD